MNRKVVCLNLDLRFDTIKEAAQWAGVSPSCISAACRKLMKSSGRKAGIKLAWAYLEEYELMTRTEITNRVLEAQSGKTHHKRLEVICLNNKRVFKDLQEAQEWAVQSANIGKCCRQEQSTAGKDPVTGEKLKWMYYKDYLNWE